MISVSFLSRNKDLASTINELDNSNTDYIHVDYMDGKFVNNTSFTFEELDSVLVNTKKELDVHIMVNNPLEYIDYFSKFNTKFITFHIESLDDPITVINAIRKKNIKVGIAINPDTSINLIKPYINLVDLVLVMSVNPGAGGQVFLNESLPKIYELSKLKGDYIISVDGGINDITGKLAIDSGVDMLVSGSYICKSDNYKERINDLKCLK